MDDSNAGVPQKTHCEILNNSLKNKYNLNRDSVSFLDEGWNGDSVGVSKIYEVAGSTVMGGIGEYKAKKSSGASHDRKL